MLVYVMYMAQILNSWVEFINLSVHNWILIYVYHVLVHFLWPA